MAAAALLAMVAAAGCSRATAPAADVWASVNGEDIRRAEVEKYYSGRLNPQAQPPSQEEALTLTLSILDELINNNILIQRARQQGLEATDGEVEDKFTEFKSPYTEEEFQRQLKDRGVTVDDLKQDIRRQLSVQKLINREVVAKIGITDKDVSDFYDQNRAQFNVSETQYRIAQMVVTPRRDPQVRNRKNDDAASDVEARRKIAALLQQVSGSTDFGEVAMDYSEDPSSASGGDLGFIPESSLNQSDPALRRVVMALRPGQISGILQQPDGFRILKLVAKEVPGQREISNPQVQQSIRETLRNRKEQLLRAAYLTSARNEGKISNYLAQQVMESAGKLPEIKLPLPAPAPAPASAPAAANP